MRYKVEFINFDGESVLPFRADSLAEAVERFRKKVERGDYWDGTDDDDFDESGTISGRITISLDGDANHWEEGQYVEFTYRGGKPK